MVCAWWFIGFVSLLLFVLDYGIVFLVCVLGLWLLLLWIGCLICCYLVWIDCLLVFGL